MVPMMRRRQTLSMWNNVRRGEHTWIFPHQVPSPVQPLRTPHSTLHTPPHAAHTARAEHVRSYTDAHPMRWQNNADFVFNSAMETELAVLKVKPRAPPLFSRPAPVLSSPLAPGCSG